MSNPLFGPGAAAYREEIRARVEAAAEGPWATDAQNEFNDYCIWGQKDQFLGNVDNGLALPVAFDLSKENAEFIAHARTDVPNLLAAIEAAERQRDDLANALRIISIDMLYAIIPDLIDIRDLSNRDIIFQLRDERLKKFDEFVKAVHAALAALPNAEEGTK